MKNNVLYNYPHERRKITYSHTWWDEGFNPIELQKLIDYCESRPSEEAKILGNATEVQIRKSNITWVNYDHNNQDIKWIFERLNYILTSLNNQFYGFDLNGYESFQFTTYKAEEAGHYNWHMDMCMDAPLLPADMQEPRKLSASLLLNDDFTGGEFQINAGTEEHAITVPTPKGRLIAFPSWMIHRVKPVLTGTRKSLVVWATGPKWT